MWVTGTAQWHHVADGDTQVMGITRGHRVPDGNAHERW